MNLCVALAMDQKLDQIGWKYVHTERLIERSVCDRRAARPPTRPRTPGHGRSPSTVIVTFSTVEL
jgi:hypothetical protein